LAFTHKDQKSINGRVNNSCTHSTQGWRNKIRTMS